MRESRESYGNHGNHPGIARIAWESPGNHGNLLGIMGIRITEMETPPPSPCFPLPPWFPSPRSSSERFRPANESAADASVHGIPPPPLFQCRSVHRRRQTYQPANRQVNKEIVLSIIVLANSAQNLTRFGALVVGAQLGWGSCRPNPKFRESFTSLCLSRTHTGRSMSARGTATKTTSEISLQAELAWPVQATRSAARRRPWTQALERLRGWQRRQTRLSCGLAYPRIHRRLRC